MRLVDFSIGEAADLLDIPYEESDLVERRRIGIIKGLAGPDVTGAFDEIAAVRDEMEPLIDGFRFTGYTKGFDSDDFLDKEVPDFSGSCDTLAGPDFTCDVAQDEVEPLTDLSGIRVAVTDFAPDNNAVKEGVSIDATEDNLGKVSLTSSDGSFRNTPGWTEGDRCFNGTLDETSSDGTKCCFRLEKDAPE